MKAEHPLRPMRIVNPLTADTSLLAETSERGDARGLLVRHHPASVALARRAIVAEIGDQVDAATIAEVEIVVSELLGNAMRHATSIDGGVRLRWQVRSGTVDVEVADGGPRDPQRDRGIRPIRPQVIHAHGRGLRIVRSIAHEWGVSDNRHGGRTVWAAVGGPSRRRRRAV